MKCPHCGTHVPDGTIVCPACHASLDATAVLPRLQGEYCPSCGAMVPEGSDSCPKCGMPVAKVAKKDNPQDRKPLPSQETGRLPRIEPALPAEQDLKDPYLHEQPIRMRSVVLAAIACILVVGGAVLLITHPWDPNAFATRATEPADTSQAGSIASVETLSGQDTSRTNTDTTVKSGDESTYEVLNQAYKELGEYSEDLESSVQRLEDTGISGDSAEREAGRSEAAELAVKISNTISDIESADVTSGTYADARTELLRIGNYLRNRSDIVSAAWSQAASSSDPEAERSQILQSVEGEGSSYGSLFKEGYANFKLTAPETASDS